MPNDSNISIQEFEKVLLKSTNLFIKISLRLDPSVSNIHSSYLVLMLPSSYMVFILSFFIKTFLMLGTPFNLYYLNNLYSIPFKRSTYSSFGIAISFNLKRITGFSGIIFAS